MAARMVLAVMACLLSMVFAYAVLSGTHRMVIELDQSHRSAATAPPSAPMSAAPPPATRPSRGSFR